MLSTKVDVDSSRSEVTIQPYGVLGLTRRYAAPSPMERAVGSLSLTVVHAESVQEYSPG